MNVDCRLVKINLMNSFIIIGLTQLISYHECHFLAENCKVVLSLQIRWLI